MSTTIGNQRSESTSKDFIQSNTSNEAQINDCKTSISNLKKTSINNKLIVKKNEKLSSFVNLDIRKKKSSNLLNTSKLVITEKDSKKEDSERTDKNHSGRKKNNKNTSNLVFEGIMNSNESNFSGLKNSTLGSRLSHIFSDHSLNFEKSGMPMNILKTNKSPKLLDKYKEISSNNMNYNKILSQTSISMLLNNSRDTFHKYKHLFGDVDSPSKFLRVSSNSLQFKKNREQNAEEGDLSTIRNKSSNRTKGFNNIFTFRKEVELAKVHPNNDIMRIKNDVININDLNLKKFFIIVR